MPAAHGNVSPKRRSKLLEGVLKGRNGGRRSGVSVRGDRGLRDGAFETVTEAVSAAEVKRSARQKSQKTCEIDVSPDCRLGVLWWRKCGVSLVHESMGKESDATGDEQA